jgi:hypothetical protein
VRGGADHTDAPGGVLDDGRCTGTGPSG